MLCSNTNYTLGLKKSLTTYLSEYTAYKLKNAHFCGGTLKARSLLRVSLFSRRDLEVSRVS